MSCSKSYHTPLLSHCPTVPSPKVLLNFSRYNLSSDYMNGCHWQIRILSEPKCFHQLQQEQSFFFSIFVRHNIPIEITSMTFSLLSRIKTSLFNMNLIIRRLPLHPTPTSSIQPKAHDETKHFMTTTNNYIFMQVLRELEDKVTWMILPITEGFSAHPGVPFNALSGKRSMFIYWMSLTLKLPFPFNPSYHWNENTNKQAMTHLDIFPKPYVTACPRCFPETNCLYPTHKPSHSLAEKKDYAKSKTCVMAIKLQATFYSQTHASWCQPIWWRLYR